MRQGGVLRLGIAEGFERRHLHAAVRDAVVSLIAAVPDFRAGRGKEFLRPVDALHRIKPGFGLRIEAVRQAVDLVHAKDGVALEEGDFARCFLARVLVDFRPADAVGIDD